jgi:cell division protein FtsB
MTTPVEERRSRASAETVLKTLTALFGLLAAVLGIWTTQLSREKQQAESRTVVVQQESSELKQQVVAMGEEIERLKAQLDAASTPGESTSSPAAGQYRVVLELDETLDLDTRRTSRVESTGTEISRARSQNLLVNPRGYEFFPISTDLNEANCRSAVEGRDNRRDDFNWDELTPGLTFCLATSESRMAGITVVEKAITYEGSIELGVQLW